MLIILSGLPGSGKTTIGKALATRYGAVYIRVDEIEHVLRRDLSDGREIGAAGYVVAHVIASSNLKIANMVIADSVNPVAESRAGWREVAARLDLHSLDVEIICSDEEEHRRRVETRVLDIDGLRPPTWEEVCSRNYLPWSGERLVLDTAVLSVEDCVERIEAAIDSLSGRTGLSGGRRG
ncbi:AAA family ATPase [Aliirhizobium terrae]|uniref:AAA family ATPase n=1 Tax=Terrirhizobium terrae TaxID=2926709 RepID=UPI00257625EB|nr:AAA family ATPase [Rhizobium sp. CC-CFT758]WJH39874.1 AAA family ATPase [Rhizobium sp. CC-CFT758]